MRTLKLLFYVLLIVVIGFLWWFLPKYSYVHKNPGFCAQLGGNFYYCGQTAGLDKLFETSK